MEAAALIVDFGPGPHRYRNPKRQDAPAQAAWLRGLSADESLVTHFRRAHFQGDEAADAVVAWMHEVGLREGMATFEQALEHGLDSVPSPPTALRVFFEEIEVVPAWLSRRTLRRACRIRDYAALGHGYVLFSVSLLAGYTSSGITKTLIATGELEKMAPRRIAETSKFIDDVYASKTLGRGSDGFKSTIRVRLMHAFVRSKLLRSGWDVRRWGVPINQADMAATVLSFSISYLLGLRALGFVIPRGDREALIHLWRYAGRLLGVDDSLVAATEAEAWKLLKLVAASQTGPDENGKALAQALLGVPIAYGGESASGKLLGRFDAAFLAGFTRHVAGDSVANGLGLPRTFPKYAFFGLAAANLCTELVAKLVPAAERLKTRLGHSLDRRRMEPLIAGKRVHFAPRDVPVKPR